MMKKAGLIFALVLALCLHGFMAAQARADVEASTWLDIRNALINDQASIVLVKDITAEAQDDPLIVPAGCTVTLDLNGHTLDRGLTGEGMTAQAGGVVLTVNGKLTLKSSASGGRITGGNNRDLGGGILIGSAGQLIMESGTVTGNQARQGGGVYVTAGGRFIVSGTPIVSDNLQDETANNVYLPQNTMIQVSGELSADALLRITTAVPPTASAPVTVTKGFGQNGTESNFLSDSSAYRTVIENDEATFVTATRANATNRYSFKLSFTKVWLGDKEDSIDWTLYHADGTVAHKLFNKTVVSDTEWLYEAWFEADGDYSIVENVPKGYKVRYENVGAHAGDTDRCYNGGKIINYKVPKTGDEANLSLWTGIIVLSIAGILLIAAREKNRREAR